MSEPKPVVNLSELTLETLSHGEKFSVQTGEIGRELGFYNVGCMLHIVPPGKAAFPYHRHHGCDEMFFVLSGTGEYRFGDKRIPIKPGDCLGAPAGGEAHQIINTGTSELRYIGFGNNGASDLVEYPDSGKINVRVGARGIHWIDSTYRQRGRVSPVEYWDGEEA